MVVKTKMVCERCKKEFERYQSLDRYKKTYCSHSCYAKDKTKRVTPFYRATRDQVEENQKALTQEA